MSDFNRISKEITEAANKFGLIRLVVHNYFDEEFVESDLSLIHRMYIMLLKKCYRNKMLVSFWDIKRNDDVKIACNIMFPEGAKF